MSGTGEPDRWIAGAQRWHPEGRDNSAQPVTLFLLAFHSTSKQVTVTRLQAPPMLASGLITDGSPLAVARKRQQAFAAVTLSPDGRRLALLTTAAAGYQVSVYPVTGGTAAGNTAGGTAKTWLDRSAASADPRRPGRSR